MAVASRLGPGWLRRAISLALVVLPSSVSARSFSPDMSTAAPPDATLRSGTNRAATPAALPDIFGPGSVLNVGNVFMKITNTGVLGNPFTTSSDPSMQWPGPSGIEYLQSAIIAVGG